ncbi:TPA: hypothetical protein HA251_07585 [Candidatus Woesearchaeota archaeon]|nr:hypothetical protein [Candidatus Woesearchaeota archaeon]
MGVEVVYAWLAAFFDQQFFNILLATGLLFLIMFVTWWVYRKLSTRNLFQLFTKNTKRSAPNFGDYLVYALKYFCIFPLLTFVGFLIFAFSLFMLMKPSTADMQANVLFIAIVMVSTIRVAAYVHESLAEDFAKLVPLSLLGVLLSSPSQVAGVGGGQIAGFIFLIPSVIKYLLFIVILEVLLRGGTWLFGHLHMADDTVDDGRPSP